MPCPGLWQFGLGPPGVVLQEELESVQKRAARFVTGNYNYETGSMTGILGQLKWESLKKRIDLYCRSSYYAGLRCAGCWPFSIYFTWSLFWHFLDKFI